MLGTHVHLPSSFSISNVYWTISGLRPSPHFSLRLFGATDKHSSRGGLGGRARVVTLVGVLKGPTPMLLTAWIRILKRNSHVLQHKIFLIPLSLLSISSACLWVLMGGGVKHKVMSQNKQQIQVTRFNSYIFIYILTMSSVHVSEYNWGVLLELIYLIILPLISSNSQHILLRIKENPPNYYNHAKHTKNRLLDTQLKGYKRLQANFVGTSEHH